MRQEKAGRTVLEVREAQPDRERLEMAAARINRLDREQLVRREAALDPLEAARRFDLHSQYQLEKISPSKLHICHPDEGGKPAGIYRYAR